MRHYAGNTHRVSSWVQLAAIMLPLAGVEASAETILFVGNSFTYGKLSPVLQYRPDTVTDLNHEGVGGVPALFKSFASQAHLSYEVSLETASGKSLDFHYEQKKLLLNRPWDHVILQAYST